MAPGVVKRLERPVLAGLRGIGRLTVAAPPPPRATGGYGRASRGGLLALFVIGLAVSWPFRGAGLTIMIVAAVALFQFFVLQYRGALLRWATVVWLMVTGAVLAAVIGVIWSRWADGSGARGDVVVLVAVIASLALLPIVRYLFRQIFGPHHPESSLPDPKDPPGLWFWTGAVEPDRATLVVRLAPLVDAVADDVVVEYSDGRRAQRSAPTPTDDRRFARIILSGLEPGTAYELRVLACGGGEIVASAVGTVTTFPPDGEPADVTMAFGSCMSTGSRGQVFDTIRQLDPQPRIFVVTGDLHYENLTSDRVDDFLTAYDMVHASHPQRRLYGSLPLAYVWDDHDFGDNDSDFGSRSKRAAQAAYRRAVPHYLGPGEPGATGPIHQECAIGRVRLLLTDNRSERNETAGQLVSAATEAWLIDRIVDPAWPVVVWVSPTPWISDDTTSDNWGAYEDQRRRIAEAIRERCGNLVMVAGDAHMVAIDDGTNSAYAGAGSGFPVLHAAALDRLGSAKGGPFSHGRYPGAGQFGLVTVTDRVHEIDVAISGRNWTGAEIVGHAFTIRADQRSRP